MSGRPISLRCARADDAPALSALALRAKAGWGHDAAFLERARPELEVTAADIAALVVIVAEREGRIAGWAGLDLDAAAPELVALFVEPAAMRTGVGRALLRAALVEACVRGVRALLIESDPDAEPFYLAHGGERTGTRRSASTGRLLPLLRLATAP